MNNDLPLTSRLLWKSLGTHVLVILVVIIIVWLAVDYFAADYFSILMMEYDIEPVASHQMFVNCVRRYLVWASVAACLVGAGISFLLMRRVIGRIVEMTRITGRIAGGDYTHIVPVSSSDEVGQLATAFNTMTASLKKIENLRRQMMIDVAHELRTPITNMRGYLEGIVDGVVKPSPETVQILLEETMRLAALVEDILRLAKAEAAKTTPRLEPVNLREAIDHSIKSFQTKLAAKQITVVTDVKEGLSPVYSDIDSLSQIFNNLFQNVCQHAPFGDTLRIEAQEAKDQVKVAFTNHDGELSQDDLPLLFERFYRAEKSRSRNHGGAGVGLAIVKELVQAQHGEVGSELDRNALRIWFTLPK